MAAIEDVVTPARIRELFYYDPETGAVGRRVAYARRVRAGETVGCKSTDGSYFVTVDKRRCALHRLAWVYVTGKWPTKLIDHINGNPADNRWSNLREADKAENGWNARMRKDNRSGVKGVSWSESRQRWVAQLAVRGKKMMLGRYRTKEEATEAVVAARVKHHGEYANHATA